MNKIRKYLIHLLGGVTEEYCERKIDYLVRVERVNAINSVLLMMERCYGMPNDEWKRLRMIIHTRGEKQQ